MSRSGVIWPLLLLVLSGLWLFQTFGGLPTAVSDLIQRGLPALLVVLGLMMLLGRRIRFGNLLAIALTIALLVGVVGVAYSRQQNIVRQDYAAPFETLVEGSVSDVRLILTLRGTDIEILPGVPGDRTIRGDYTGSIESQITTDYSVDGATATFTLSETPRNSIPSLELVGRGKLTLTLPFGVNIAQLQINGEGGALTLDSSSNSIAAISLIMVTGDISATFAETSSGLIGDLKTGAGTITVTIPPTLPAEIALLGGGAASAQFDANVYTLNINRVLVPKSGQPAQVRLNLDAPGQLTIQ
ncbi:MAG: hypothetical protein KF726_03500 [Anaerolineae bacterium]|nr:hypothetical protein [Anaerolineae bacterium]